MEKSQLPDTIGAVLRKARIDNNLGQQELARIMGISVWTLNRFEHGKRQFDIDWLARIPVKVRAPIAKYLSMQTQRQFWHLKSMAREALPAA